MPTPTLDVVEDLGDLSTYSPDDAVSVVLGCIMLGKTSRGLSACTFLYNGKAFRFDNTHSPQEMEDWLKGSNVVRATFGQPGGR